MFPRSRYKNQFGEGIEETKRFNDVSASGEGIVFLDSEEIKSFDDALKPYFGKTVYVDIWATWCGPCLESFSFVPEFKEAAKDMDITYLYYP